MSHFYGGVKGFTDAYALGSRDTGMIAIATGWNGGIKVELAWRDGDNHFTVSRIAWPDERVLEVLCEGTVERDHKAGPATP